MPGGNVVGKGGQDQRRVSVDIRVSIPTPGILNVSQGQLRETQARDRARGQLLAAARLGRPLAHHLPQGHLGRERESSGSASGTRILKLGFRIPELSLQTATRSATRLTLAIRPVEAIPTGLTMPPPLTILASSRCITMHLEEPPSMRRLSPLGLTL